MRYILRKALAFASRKPLVLLFVVATIGCQTAMPPYPLLVETLPDGSVRESIDIRPEAQEIWMLQVQMLGKAKVDTVALATSVLQTGLETYIAVSEQKGLLEDAETQREIARMEAQLAKYQAWRDLLLGKGSE